MKRYKKELLKRKAFMSKCRVNGGYCFNPLCAVGCIDAWQFNFGDIKIKNYEK